MCSFPGADDNSLFQKFERQYKSHPNYHTPQMKLKEPQFTILHYASAVTYSIQVNCIIPLSPSLPLSPSSLHPSHPSCNPSTLPLFSYFFHPSLPSSLVSHLLPFSPHFSSPPTFLSGFS